MSQHTEDVYKEKRNQRIRRNNLNNNYKIKFKKKENIKNNLRKMFIIISSVIMSFLSFSNVVFAKNIDSAHIYLVGDCGKLLTYKGSPIKVSYVEYTEDGVHYPAYCLDASKPGAETQEYTVSVSGSIKDVGLWRRIINGYPYKTIDELGVKNKEEAFTATKQAIYCYLYKHNPSDYGAIGEAGQRTLNAFRKIISDAENSSETKISSTISINRESDEWKQDELDENYISKTFSVTAGAEISIYKINVVKEDGSNLSKTEIENLLLNTGLYRTLFTDDETFTYTTNVNFFNTKSGSITFNFKAINGDTLSNTFKYIRNGETEYLIADNFEESNKEKERYYFDVDLANGDTINYNEIETKERIGYEIIHFG